MKKIFITIIFLFFFFSLAFSQVSPKLLEDLKRDYQPLTGLIIGIEGNEVILDKGRAQGVKPKDIFTIYKKVKKIVHPETKESLGFLKEPIGKIEVLRVDENFATARILSKKEEIPVPTPIKRNTDLRILILTEGNLQDETLFLTLKTLLPESEIFYEPHLKIGQLSATELHSKKIDLVFVLGEGYLKVYNSYLDLIRAYGSPLPSGKVLASPPSVQALPSMPLTQTQPIYPSVPQISQVTLLGKMPGEVLQAEFEDINGDGKRELIYFNQEGLFIVQVKGGLIAKYKPAKGEILSFSVGPSGWIALNVYERNVGMRSEILHYTPQGIQPVITNLNLILQFVDFVGTGKRDTLLAQTFDSETFFGKEVYIVKREGNALRYAQKLEVPDNFRLIGTSFADLDGDGERELITFLSDGRIGIYKKGQLIYSTPFQVSRHFYHLKLSKGKKGQEVVKAIVYPMICPIVVDLNHDGREDLLFAKVDFPLERVAGELKTLPLNQASLQLYFLSYAGSYYFRTLPVQETGILTGLGTEERYIYFVTVKGVYPGQSESFLYSILY